MFELRLSCSFAIFGAVNIEFKSQGRQCRHSTEQNALLITCITPFMASIIVPANNCIKAKTMSSYWARMEMAFSVSLGLNNQTFQFFLCCQESWSSQNVW